jgi:hypothetical protein
LLTCPIIKTLGSGACSLPECTGLVLRKDMESHLLQTDHALLVRSFIAKTLTDHFSPSSGTKEEPEPEQEPSVISVIEPIHFLPLDVTGNGVDEDDDDVVDDEDEEEEEESEELEFYDGGPLFKWRINFF